VLETIDYDIEILQNIVKRIEEDRERYRELESENIQLQETIEAIVQKTSEAGKSQGKIRIDR